MDVSCICQHVSLNLVKFSNEGQHQKLFGEFNCRYSLSSIKPTLHEDQYNFVT
jgi:hypothetical protein